MPARPIYLIFFMLAITVAGHHHYKKYNHIKEHGGKIRILGRVIYSKEPKPVVEAALPKEIPPPKKQQVIHQEDQPEIVQITQCPPRYTKPVETKRKSEIYQLKDEYGRVIFTDKTSSNVAVNDQSYELSTRELSLSDKYFNLNIDFRFPGSVPDLKDKLQTTLTNAYRIVSNLLGEERL